MKPARYRKQHLSPAKKLAVLVLILSISSGIFFGFRGVTQMTERMDGMDFYHRLSGEKMFKADSPQLSAPAGMEGGFLLLPMTGPSSVMDFDSMQAEYADCVGWIEIGDLGIDYPIMRGEDNTYYLNHLADGTANVCGSVMMDTACTGYFSDHVTVLYGQQVQSGAMFGSLGKYKDEGFYLTHPTYRIYSPGGDYEVQVFAAGSVDLETLNLPINFSTEQELQQSIAALKNSSDHITDLDIRFGDRLVLLSTCAAPFQNSRFVVAGRLQYAS